MDIYDGFSESNQRNQQKKTKKFAFLTESKDRLHWKVKLARMSIFWEQVWSALYLPALVLLLFAALSWLGVFEILDEWARISLLILMGIGVVVWSYPILKIRYPDYQSGLNRVEQSSGHDHRPLTAIEDRQVSNKLDPGSSIMWKAHQLKVLAALKHVKSGYPHPVAFKRDPWGLRIAVIFLFIIGFTVADGERGIRIVEAVTGTEEVSTAIGRIDAWVTPPAYTDRVPIFLTGDIGPSRTDDSPLSVPEGSVVVIRSQGLGGEFAVFKGSNNQSMVQLDSIAEAAGENDENSSSLPVEHQTELVEDSQLEVRDGVDILHSWNFIVVPDTNPIISFEEEPEAQLSGSLRLIYRATDDYGVASVEGLIDADLDESEIDLKTKPRPLVQPPRFPLSLPRRSSEEPVAESYRNLTSHPWAGSKVILTLEAEDERGQKGYSKPHKMTLPIREFRELLSKAIVEQRRNLAMDANRHVEVIDAMDAIMLAPHTLLSDAKYYPGMLFVYKRLVNAQTDEELLEVVDLLWELALTIEDGDLSLAERALRDAQQALQRALEEGASDEEISRLTQELREALQRYMQAMMQQMRNNPQAFNPLNQNSQGVNPQDLDEMLRQIEELAKTGARDAAQQLLSQMQQMLENMQTSQSQMRRSNEMMRQMMNALNQLSQMIQRQQELMDETFQSGQQGQQNQNGNPNSNQSQNPMTPEQLAEALKSLQQQQGALAQQLDDLMQRMQQGGMKGSQSLGEAGESMKGAQQSIGQGDTGNAVTQQGQALDALKRGAQQLSEQMMGNGNRPGGQMMGRGRPNQDPLGRPRSNQGPDFGDHVKVPEQIDVQRARKILEELRRRFSDSNRPDLEMDYIERLLNPY